MRLSFILVCFLRIASSAALGQTIDSIQISLSRKSTDTLIFGQTFAIDGSYKIPEENLMRYPKLADVVLVQPAALVGPEKILRITSQPNFVQQSPAYEFRRYPYVNIEPPKDTTPKTPQNVYYDGNSILDGIYISESIPFKYDDTLQLMSRNPSGWKSAWDGYYVKYNSDPSVTDSVINTLKNDFENYRKTVAQPVINELLQPFYLSPHEVTNAQYREFVHWVRDSIVFDLLFRELSDYDAIELLDCTKKQRALFDYSDPDSLAIYLTRYGFNYDYFKQKKINIYNYYDNEEYFSIVSQLYYPKVERFYQRREFNVSKFVYQSTACSPTPVYPDTLCWLRDSPYPEYGPFTDLYFWHPVYDNYPVVGLTEAQMKAYCDWLQRKKNKELKDAPYTIRVELPQLFHYEMAAKLCAPTILRNKIDAQADAPFIIERAPEDAIRFITRCSPISPKEIMALKERFPRLIDWHTINQTYPIWYLTGGVSEYCSESTTPQDQMTVLGGNRTIGLVDKQENQLNTIFYQQTVPADKGSSTIGFRPVIYLDWK
ncbi:MAG: SUMF1/EgtB/PvdO family nonheme iron enzyme [Fluviicola sp.]|nr:SUMF1/EgtB/PvdO family nonheme iron enzyme [Fluviicola sp.]